MDHVRPLLLKNLDHRTLLSRTQEIIDKAYFESFTSEYEAGVVRDLAYLETSHRVPSSGCDLSYRFIFRLVRRNGLLDRILGADAVTLEQIRHEPLWVGTLAAYLATLPVPPGLETGILLGQAGTSTPEIAIMRPSEVVRVAPVPEAPAIGIITALPKEYAAVQALLKECGPHNIPGRGAGRRYLFGTIPASDGGRHRVVLAMLPDMGNNMASIAATLMQERFQSVETIVMSGIAGGVPHPTKAQEHVRLGDIVVSNRNGVVQYDNLKSERIGDVVEDKVRAAPRPPSAKMVEAVRFLEADAYRGQLPWNSLIDEVVRALNFSRPADETDVLHDSVDREKVVPHPVDGARRPSLPRLFHGPIASANSLLKDPIKRDWLRDRFGVKAIEMEGSGVSDATWHQENGYIVVRGICDYCDMSKGDDWQNYAAAVAAGYTVALIASLPALPAGALGSIAPSSVSANEG
jgi:nucleoside phosphorylase